MNLVFLFTHTSKFFTLFQVIVCTLSACTIGSFAHPYLYNPYYKFFNNYNTPYYNNLGSYGNNVQSYPPYYQSFSQNGLYEDNNLGPYPNNPNRVPSLNVLPEVPYTISTKFTVVPMVVVSRETMNLIGDAQIMGISKQKPTMMVRTPDNGLVQCTPAVKIILDEPMVIYSLKNSIPFPSTILIRHGNYRIPLKVGAVIAPVGQNTYISAETPVYLKVVYAVSTTPLTVDYVNNVKDVVVVPETDAVVVESEPSLPPKNVTILNFPETIGEPSVSVDEEDEELGKYLLLL